MCWSVPHSGTQWPDPLAQLVRQGQAQATQSTSLSGSLGPPGGLVAAAYVRVCGTSGAAPAAVKAFAHLSEHRISEGQKIKSLHLLYSHLDSLPFFTKQTLPAERRRSRAFVVERGSSH